MAKGIIYCMTTVVPGLVKIGKTGSGHFADRMYHLERNGYFNVVGLRRHFAIEVDDYDEKEELLHEIFSKSRVPGSELFALDVDLVVQLLSSLEGTQVYPEGETKDQAFDQATDSLSAKDSWALIPDGTYHMDRKVKGYGAMDAVMVVQDGRFIVKAGCRCVPAEEGKWLPETRRNAKIVGGILQEDVECPSPSTAGHVVTGSSNNGWMSWKDESGRRLDWYRRNIGGTEFGIS